jgi:hypothetical protein
VKAAASAAPRFICDCPNRLRAGLRHRILAGCTDTRCRFSYSNYGAPGGTHRCAHVGVERHTGVINQMLPAPVKLRRPVCNGTVARTVLPYIETITTGNRATDGH